jgi:hypothetical protein
VERFRLALTRQALLSIRLGSYFVQHAIGVGDAGEGQAKLADPKVLFGRLIAAPNAREKGETAVR